MLNGATFKTLVERAINSSIGFFFLSCVYRPFNSHIDFLMRWEASVEWTSRLRQKHVSFCEGPFYNPGIFFASHDADKLFFF